MIYIKTKTATCRVKVYFSNDCHSAGEKRGAVFHNTVSFANTALASWEMTGFALFIRGFKIHVKGTKNKGIILL